MIIHVAQNLIITLPVANSGHIIDMNNFILSLKEVKCELVPENLVEALYVHQSKLLSLLYLHSSFLFQKVMSL